MGKRVKHGRVENIGPNMVRIIGNNPNITDGVSIGANTSDNLQVDNNEVIIGANASKSGKTLYPTNGNIRVLSAQPMLNGKSPVQLLYGGVPPNVAFAMQEQYKDMHGINDDGSRQNAQFGILKKIKQSVNRHNNNKRQTLLKGIDWSGIKTTNDRAYNQEYINYINDSLVNYGYNNNQRAAILANIIEESGGDPFAEGPGGYYGLLQWGSDRYTKTNEKDVYKEIDNQLKYLHGTIGETKDKKSWTHGGKGSGYNSFTDAMDAYNSDDLNKVMHGFTWGYVRPAGKQNSYLNRQKVADQLINIEGFKFGGRKSFQAGGDDNILMRIDSENNLIDSIQPSIVTAKLPAKFNGSQAAAARYAEGYKFGKKVAQQRDNVTKQVVDKLLPTNANKDLDDNVLGYTPIVGDILQGVQGVKDISKGNYLKGAIGLGLLAAPNIIEKPVKAAIKYGAYKIKDLSGYMLKSLMRNNPLEKQLNNIGTINVNNIRALINKGSDVEKSVVDKVLASEQFAGKKAIDYNDFRKAVQDELITYKRTPDTHYENYGLDRLFPDEGGGSAGWYGTLTPETYTFSSPDILQGSGKHYSENTLGHSRTYTTKEEPDILHVMESQSDWAQQNVVNDRLKQIARANERYPGGFIARRERAINAAEKDIKQWEDMIESGVNGVGEKLEPWQIENIRTDYLYNAKQRLKDLKAKYSDVSPQEKYLSDNYVTRQIQENLRFAAEKGQTKMRYPTRETAAKIEGYPKREVYFDAQGNDITTSGQSIYTFGEKLDKELKDINDELKKLQEYDYRFDVKDKMTELFERKDNILKGESKLRPGITKKTVYDYEDILKKYTKFPDQYKKLYKNADVRTITDRMGNTWYEVDIPKDYLNQEWKFKFGGQTNINSLGERPNAKYRKQMKNKRNKAALGRQQFSISGLPAFDFTIPNTFGNYSLNKPFYPTYVDGPLVGLRVPQSELNLPKFSTDFTPKSTVGQVDPFMGTKPAFGTSTTATPATTSIGDLTKGSGLSTTAMSAIGAGINTLGSLIGAGIQQSAINNLEAPQRQYTLLNPVKLKTKININPQIAKMREMQAQISDAARRTSGSSREAYRRILAGHNRLLDSTMDLYGRKENTETELINRDRLNQQRVAHTNATNVMNTINYNNEVATEMRNRQRVATSNNWTTALNTTAGAWAGPNGFIDRANALRVKAGELYTQAIANPTAARLLYGDVDFTTGANKRRAFNTIYDFLNNNRFA